jgi:hypothetical protein
LPVATSPVTAMAAAFGEDVTCPLLCAVAAAGVAAMRSCDIVMDGAGATEGAAIFAGVVGAGWLGASDEIVFAVDFEDEFS